MILEVAMNLVLKKRFNFGNTESVYDKKKLDESRRWLVDLDDK